MLMHVAFTLMRLARWLSPEAENLWVDRRAALHRAEEITEAARRMERLTAEVLAEMLFEYAVDEERKRGGHEIT